MRIVIGFMGLLIVVAIVGLIAGKQLAPSPAPHVAPARDGSVSAIGSSRQRQQLQDDIKRSVEGAIQQRRPTPDEP